jgi:hypothetical protein
VRCLNFWHEPRLARAIFRISHLSRQQKLKLFYKHVRPTKADLVLDVGVTPQQWSTASGAPAVENFLEASYPWPERVVGLSIDDLAGYRDRYPSSAAVQGDACQLPFSDASFDIVFTNAVIEHVGDKNHQARLVGECLRVARRAVFVAAPNRWFPYDTHVAFPLVHWLPRAIWRPLLNESALHLVSPPTLLRYFPEPSNPRLLSPLWAPSIAVLASPCVRASRMDRVSDAALDNSGSHFGERISSL